MAKSVPQFLCSECGETFPKWMGKCSNCGGWNTITEFREAKISDGKGKKLSGGIDLITQSDVGTKESPISKTRISTGIVEVDRVLGTGFFPGSLVLFGGSPGIGKSTLALQTFLHLEEAFYFSGEESQEQISSHIKRVGSKSSERGNVFSTNSLEDICETILKNKSPLAVIDSIQMIAREDGNMGQISQLRENAEVLLKLAKSTGTTILLIGHVTKADEIAGPKILEHLVDVVLYLEGEKTSELRILRTTKNRFGSTQEVGVFEMTNQGLKELKNPSEFFLAERAENAAGSAITVVREGARNFLIEIQALTVKTNFGLPRRTSHGVDLSKLHLLLAVISKFTPFSSEQADAYINIIGGLKVREPAADLAICAAILSSFTGKEIPADTIILGEVGLSGEVRRVANPESRLVEAEKLGFQRAVVPRIPKGISIPKKLEVVEVKSILELMPVVFGKENRT